MPLVHRILITLRTLMEEDPQPSYSRKRKPSGNSRNNRSSQTTAMVLTFRDLFRSGGLNVILDEMDVGRRPSRRNSRTQSVNNRTNDYCVPKAVLCSTSQPRHDPDTRVILRDQVAPVMTPPFKPGCYVEDETVPLLHEEAVIVAPCTDMVVSQIPFHPSRFFSNLPLIARRHNKKQENLTVALNPSDESKTVETLRKVLKWSPRKQNSATFAVSLPVEEEKHLALAVVENAVNTVKEEQLRKKKKKFFWLKFC